MRKHPLVITVAIGLVIAVVGIVLLATADDDSVDGVLPVDTASNDGRYLTNAPDDVNFRITGAASRGLEQITWKADRIIWKPDPADCVDPGSGAFADQNPFPATWLHSRIDCYNVFHVSVGLRNGDVFTEFGVHLHDRGQFLIGTVVCASGLRCTNRVERKSPLMISTTLSCTDPNNCPLPHP